MSWFITVLNVAWNVLVIGLAAAFSFAIYRLLAKGSYTPTGDPDLAAALGKNASKWSTRRVAVAYVDLNRRPNTRLAFMGCDENTAFELGSVTKALTGLLVADAVGRRELALSDQLSTLDERLFAPLGDKTLKSLVTHTSGLPRVPLSLLLRGYAGLLFGLSPYPRTGPDIVALASKQRLKGSGVAYSNLGGALAGQLVAQRAGSGYHDLLRERILEPLGMANTTTDPARHKVKRGWTSVGRRSLPWRMDGWAPAGGAVSTAGDMAKLVESLLRKQAPGRRAMQPFGDIETGRANNEMAIFWQVDTVTTTKRHMVWHNGQTGGYSAFLGVFPEAKRGIVVLSDTAVAAITQRMATRIVRAMVEGQ